MGRKEERAQPLNLEVKVPTLFRCPISLDVMKSPVSLCTGVTYDRASIQRWLDSGNMTCPATMQPLPSTDLIPNLTLQRLIQLWSTSASSASVVSTLGPRYPAADLLRELRSSSNPSLALRRLADFFLNTNNDDFEKNRLIDAGDCATDVVTVLKQNAGQIEILEEAARVLALILTEDCIEENNKKIAASFMFSDLDTSVSALLLLLKEGKTLVSRIDSARILNAILSSIQSSDANARVLIAEKPDLISELIHLIGPLDDGLGKEKMNRSAIEAGLACLMGICGVRRARVRMVKEGIVPAATKVLSTEVVLAPAASAEKALKLLEAASGTSEGRSAICEAANECLGAVLGRMMKVGKEGTEAAVVVLWSVCHFFRDRRAVEAVAEANGGVTKILLLMQSNCSPAVRQMASDLLKIFRVNSKSCLAGYDTKTTHIMPF